MDRRAFLLSGLALAACGEQDRPRGYNLPPDSLHEIGGLETARGSFQGLSGHATSGTVSVFRARGKWFVSLGKDFSFDGAPDPKVAFGEQGFKADAILGPLEANEGPSTYEVEPPLDVGDYTEVWLWCEEFAVPLGMAKLELL